MDTNTVPDYQATKDLWAKRRQEALKLHRDGASLKDIGAKFGVGRERARQLVAAAIREQAR